MQIVSFFILGLLEFAGAAAATYPLPSNHDALIGQVQYVIVRQEDTLLSLGRTYGVGYQEIVAANPKVDVWLPAVGSTVVIPTQHVLPDAPRQGIVINVAEQRLYYFPASQQGQLPTVETYPVSVGTSGRKTPLGQTQVVAKYINPVWYPPQSIRKEHAARGEVLPAVVMPGADNPLGNFALRLSMGSGAYLIHGTNVPLAIGMAVTHGCLRMFPEDIEHLFNVVPVGTPVLIVNQPYKMGWYGNALFMQVHQQDLASDDVKQADMTQLTRMFVSATQFRSAKIDWHDTEKLLSRESIVPVKVRLLP